jgi:hypothetical protein
VKRFRFPLARVLRVRELEHDIALAAWREGEEAARRARAASEGLRSSIAAVEAELLELREGGSLDPTAALFGYRRADELVRALAAAREVERRAQAEALARAVRGAAAPRRLARGPRRAARAGEAPRAPPRDPRGRGAPRRGARARRAVLLAFPSRFPDGPDRALRLRPAPAETRPGPRPGARVSSNLKPSVLKPLLIGFGGVLLFCGAFVGFATWRGAELHELPWIGLLFPLPEDDLGDLATHPDAPPRAETSRPPRPQADPPRPRSEPAKVARASLLDAFTLEPPYSAAELQTLVDALKESHHEAELRLEAIAAREAAVEAREAAVADKEQELVELKARLDAMTQGSGAPDRVRSKAEELEELAWSAKSALFAEGDVEPLATRLLGYPAIEAARILAGLPPERAQELLAALPESKWREYAEAYASARALATRDE